MRRRLIIAIGMASPLALLMLCVAAVLLTGLVGWLLLGSEEQQRTVQIAPLAPLSPLTATPTVESNKVSSELTPLAEAEPVTENQVLVSQAPPTPTPNIEDVLGFPLPAGAVNSVTQEGVATRLIIPKLSLDAPIVISPIKDQTWQVDHLGQAIGHLEGTAAPGSNSNMVLAGHITLAEGVYGPFAGLAQLSPGDVLIVYQGDQKFNYVVDGYQIVERTAIEVTHPTATGQLTLITCNNWNSELKQYEQRLVVKSHLDNG